MGDESSTYVENFIGTINPSSNNELTSILYMENLEQSTTAGDTAYRAIGPIALPAGSSTLFVGQWTKAGTTSASFDSSYWWVDDLSISTPAP